jgi:hypothetical protein
MSPDGCWSTVFIGDVLEPGVKSPPQECEEAGVSAALSGGLAAAAITQVEEAKPARVELYTTRAPTSHFPIPHRFHHKPRTRPAALSECGKWAAVPCCGHRETWLSAHRTEIRSNQNSPWRMSCTLHQLATPSCRSGHLDNLGYRIVIGGGHLEIKSRDRRTSRTHCTDVAWPVPCVSRGRGGLCCGSRQCHGVAPAHGAHRTHHRIAKLVTTVCHWDRARPEFAGGALRGVHLRACHSAACPKGPSQ